MKSALTRFAFVASVFVLLLSLLAGSAPLAQESTAEDEKLTFTVGTTTDMTSTNPMKACCVTDYEMMILAYDLLLSYDPADLTPAPGLAESWELSDDGTTWTFKVREGVKWSDGTPLTARDIAFTYNFVKDNSGTGTFNDVLGYPESFSAPDDTTFVWEMETPTTSPVAPPFLPILPEHIWKEVDGKSSADIIGFRNIPTVGSGPFVLEEWKPGEYFRMSANEEYWGGAPVIDELVFRIFQNQEAMVQALKSGEIDAADSIEPTLFESLQGDPTIEALATNEQQVYSFAFNLKQGKNASADYGDTISTSHPALQDVNVRRAIAHSVDKQTLVDTVLLGYGTPADSFLLPTYPTWYKPAEGDQVYEFDLAKANQMYDEGGYLDTDSDGIREMPGGGEPFEFDLVTIADLPYSVDSGKLIKGWMEETGWDINLIPASETRAVELWGTSDFDAYLWYWDGSPDPDFMTSIFTTDQCGTWSDGCYSDGEMDALYESQRVEANVKERQETVHQIQDKFYEDVPEIMNFYVSTLQAYRKDRWTGFVPQPAPNGSVIYGFTPDSYLNIEPVTNADGTVSAGASGGGIPASVWAGLGVGVIVLASLGIAMSRRKDDEDKV